MEVVNLKKKKLTRMMMVEICNSYSYFLSHSMQVIADLFSLFYVLVYEICSKFMKYNHLSLLSVPLGLSVGLIYVPILHNRLEINK